ncbi:MAG TPA: glycerol dehydrogenase [Thermodesulfobacteriota bacterium]|nr:glycerol dehydrogenase [Thermodesulfobacteriota bacterium]
MVRIFTAPNRYIQGCGVLENVGKYVSHLGRHFFILGGKSALSSVRETVLKSMTLNSMKCQFVVFSGNGTRSDASALVKRATDFGADVIVGAGGGLALDTAKAVAYEMDLPLVMVPTIASTDAPCSAEALQYTDEHQFDRELKLKRNPDVILVDSKIIAEAPTRFFVAGMGDALSTWFEASTCLKSGAKNFSGGVATAAGLSIARLAYDTLLEYGLAAKLAVDQNVVTPAVERVIEANTLSSSLGFENCGIGAAHSISVGIGKLEGAENCLHGELVGFGTLVNLVLENYPKDEIDKVFGFCSAVGLPIVLEQLGVKDASPAKLMKAAEIALGKGSFMQNLSFEVSPQLVVDSIIGANALGNSFRP